MDRFDYNNQPGQELKKIMRLYEKSENLSYNSFL